MFACEIHTSTDSQERKRCYSVELAIPAVSFLFSMLQYTSDVNVPSHACIESNVMVPFRNAMHLNLPKRKVKKEKKARRSLVDDMVPMEAE